VRHHVIAVFVSNETSAVKVPAFDLCLLHYGVVDHKLFFAAVCAFFAAFLFSNQAIMLTVVTDDIGYACSDDPVAT
jgi:hypothetical protein